MTDIRLESELVYGRFRRVLRRTRSDILARLATVPSDLQARRRWLYRGLEQIDGMLKGKASIIEGKVVIEKPGLADVLAGEMPVEKLYEGGLRDAQQRLNLGFPILNRDVVEYAANYEFGWLQNLRDDCRAKVAMAIRSGVLLGEGTDKIARRITGSGLTRGVWPTVEARARTIARTEVREIVLGGRMQGYQELDVETVKLAGRTTTCKRCLELFALGEIPLKQAMAIRLHPNCVHDWVPVVRRGVRL